MQQQCQLWRKQNLITMVSKHLDIFFFLKQQYVIKCKKHQGKLNSLFFYKPWAFVFKDKKNSLWNSIPKSGSSVITGSRLRSALVPSESAWSKENTYHNFMNSVPPSSQQLNICRQTHWQRNRQRELKQYYPHICTCDVNNLFSVTLLTSFWNCNENS